MRSERNVALALELDVMIRSKWRRICSTSGKYRSFIDLHRFYELLLIHKKYRCVHISRIVVTHAITQLLGPEQVREGARHGDHKLPLDEDGRNQLDPSRPVAPSVQRERHRMHQDQIGRSGRGRETSRVQLPRRHERRRQRNRHARSLQRRTEGTVNFC